jgi:hypothetical protein
MPRKNDCIHAKVCFVVEDREGCFAKTRRCCGSYIKDATPSASHNTDFMKLADALEERAFVELKKEVGKGDAQWARGILTAVNCIRSGQLHKI